MATTINAYLTVNEYGQITPVGADTVSEAWADDSDATYGTVPFADQYVDLPGTFTAPDTPADHSLAAIRLVIRRRCSGAPSVVGGRWGGVSYAGGSLGAIALASAGEWETVSVELGGVPATSSFTCSVYRGTVAPYALDLATIHAEYDYRQLPSFTIAAVGSEDRNPTIQVEDLDPDGLTVTSWAVSVEGAVNWSRSALGSWPAGGVVVADELPDDTYDLTVSITTAAGTTTHTATFTIASATPLSYLQDVVYEASLAAHFSMACNSVAGIWYCDAAGVLQFARTPAAEYSAYFTDTRTTDPLGVEYTGLSLSYDSKNLINDLDVTNHGAAWDPDNAVWISDDTQNHYTNAASAKVWGRRSTSLDMCVRDAYGALQKRIQALASKYATPVRTPQSVTFNAQAYPWAAKIDLNAKVRVARKGVLYGCVVVGVEHQMGPQKWLTTLKLTKE